MSYTLYDVVVPRFKQTLSAMPGILHKAVAFCETKKIDPDTLINARLYPDMHPFHWQISAVIIHTATALAAVESGVFSPQQPSQVQSFPGLKNAIAEAAETVASIDPAIINARESHDLVLSAGRITIDFTVANFLTSFSLPNHYFHASTAYAILRHNGVGIGKPDFLGQFQRKP